MNRARPAAALLLLTAAVALQQAATREWSRVVAADGATFLLTPVGVSRRAAAPAGVRPRTTDCRWWPTYGDTALCGPAPGSEAAGGRLRLAYPALVVALWGAVAAFFLVALRVPQRRWVRAAASWVVAALAAAGIALFVDGTAHGLSAVAGLSRHFVGPGLWLAAGATGAAIAAGVAALRDETSIAASRQPSATPPA